MSLVPMKKILAAAAQGKYAVGCFECWNLESLCAVLEAAEAESSPVIVGFSGVGVNSTWLKSCGIETIGAMARKHIQICNVPAGLAFNEAVDSEQIRIALTSGFNGVSIDTSNMPLEKNLQITKRLVLQAANNGIDVEACMGKLHMRKRGSEGGLMDEAGEKVVNFIDRTGADSLAISSGNLRFQSAGRAYMDLKIAHDINDRVHVPIAIKSASAFPEDMVRKAISSGVVKFNVSSVLKEAFYDGLREGVGHKKSTGPYLATGTRKPLDVLSRARLRLRSSVSKLMKLYGSSCQV